ncbi:DMT family transporter [SAR116 cluster bacterium]|nr:DMT family transporter [SAR116 cluster bacterium]
MTIPLTTRPDRRPFIGLGMALAGALIITPDTLLIRLSGLEGWGLNFWRGLLIGFSLLVLWLASEGRHAWRQLTMLHKPPALIIIFCNFGNSLAFNFATMETSITVVVTALASAPLLAAGLSFLFLREPTPLRTWIAIAATMLGVLIVIFNGQGALLAPTGNVWLGGGLGVLAALGIASVFVVSRRHHDAPVLLACGIGILLSGVFGYIGAPVGGISGGNMLPILLMGLFVMPVSWGLLALAPRHTSPTNVSLFMLLEMVLGPFWVWIGTGERPNLPMIGGAALVLLTLMLYFIAAAREAQKLARTAA